MDTASFSYDMSRKETWTLAEHTPRRLNEKPLIHLIPFFRENEIISGQELLRRSRKLHTNYGQEDAEYLLANPEEIPEAFRDFYLIFPGTIWRDPYRRLRIP